MNGESLEKVCTKRDSQGGKDIAGKWMNIYVYVFFSSCFLFLFSFSWFWFSEMGLTV
jgi:hypothetical protein